MTQQCAVAGLPRKTNDGCFDAANANKSCVRVHGVNPPSFPSIPQHENAALGTNETVTFSKFLDVLRHGNVATLTYYNYLDFGLSGNLETTPA